MRFHHIIRPALFADGDHTSLHHQHQPLVSSSEPPHFMRECHRRIVLTTPSLCHLIHLPEVQIVVNDSLSKWACRCDISNLQDSTPLELSGTYEKRASLAIAELYVLLI